MRNRMSGGVRGRRRKPPPTRSPGSDLFEMALQSQIFVDKSGLIEKTNRCVRKLQRYLCVSRPRRFGKSMAADMLAAYYDRSTDTDALFRNLKIGRSETYKKHRNQYAGIFKRNKRH